MVGKLVHGLRITESDSTIVDSIARLSLVTHRARVAHVYSSSVGHEALHQLEILLDLIEARVGGDFDLGLGGGVAAEAE